MSGAEPWIAAQAEGGEDAGKFDSIARKREKRPLQSRSGVPELNTTGLPESGLRAHQFPSEITKEEREMGEEFDDVAKEPEERGEELDYEEMTTPEFPMEEQRWEERRRARELQRQQEMDREADLRRYRGRTVKLMRRYMRMALEAGRLPSVLGSALFGSGVTSYSVVTFEDRVIFVRDMEICLERLDDFSRELIARYVLQEHSLADAARLLHCDEKTIRRNIAQVLDDCSEILLKMGLLRSLDLNREKACQGGKNDEFSASDC